MSDTGSDTGEHWQEHSQRSDRIFDLVRTTASLTRGRTASLGQSNILAHRQIEGTETRVSGDLQRILDRDLSMQPEVLFSRALEQANLLVQTRPTNITFRELIDHEKKIRSWIDGHRSTFSGISTTEEDYNRLIEDLDNASLRVTRLFTHLNLDTLETTRAIQAYQTKLLGVLRVAQDLKRMHYGDPTPYSQVIEDGTARLGQMEQARRRQEQQEQAQQGQ
jgi:hypothetical protein